MRKSLASVLVGAILLLGMISCPANSNTDAKSAVQLAVPRVGEEVKTAGETVRYEIRVTNAPEAISAFGLDIAYQPANVTYTEKWERGPLTADFTEVGANQIGEGRIRVGGFTVGKAISLDASGVLAILEFEAGAFTPPQLSVVDTVDNLASFSLTASQ